MPTWKTLSLKLTRKHHQYMHSTGSDGIIGKSTNTLKMLTNKMYVPFIKPFTAVLWNPTVFWFLYFLTMCSFILTVFNFSLSPSVKILSSLFVFPFAALSPRLPIPHRRPSLAAAVSFSSLFAANGPLICCVQGNKSHPARTQVLWLPLHVSQSGQFATVC